MLKIDQEAFVQDFVIEEELTECNANVILMKTGSSIKINKFDNYEEIELRSYQRLIDKLIYLTYSTRPDIAFIIG